MKMLYHGTNKLLVRQTTITWNKTNITLRDRKGICQPTDVSAPTERSAVKKEAQKLGRYTN
jgi:hypothetical protein